MLGATFQAVYDSHNKDEPMKVAFMLHIVGEDALEIYNTFHVESAGKAVYGFRRYCTPKRNIVFERHQSRSHPMPEAAPLISL